MMRNGIVRMGIMTVTVFLSSALILMAQTSGKTPDSKQVLKGKTVNINKATAEDLVKNVPLITPELAKRIVQYRKENGDYQALEELMEVDGFSRELFRRIKTFFLLEGVGGKDCTC